MRDIDDLIADDEEGRPAKAERSDEDIDLYPKERKIEIGEVERFFDRIGVAAIHLSGDLKVGDTIQIEGGPEPVRVEVLSMQIDRKDVEAASSGDSVGIKVVSAVGKGYKVYLV
jgi:translation elongation factor EF-Tu-like GTPase